MSAQLAVVPKDHVCCTAVDRLVAALKRHGFENVSADHEGGLCIEDDERPQIPVIRISGKDKAELETFQTWLTDRILGFYEASDTLDDRERDSHLTVGGTPKKVVSSAAHDENIDRDLELELSLEGAEVLATMPRELFEMTPGLGRSIRERYNAKLNRFAEYLERTT